MHRVEDGGVQLRYTNMKTAIALVESVNSACYSYRRASKHERSDTILLYTVLCGINCSIDCCLSLLPIAEASRLHVSSTAAIASSHARPGNAAGMHAVTMLLCLVAQHVLDPLDTAVVLRSNGSLSYSSVCRSGPSNLGRRHSCFLCFRSANTVAKLTTQQSSVCAANIPVARKHSRCLDGAPHGYTCSKRRLRRRMLFCLTMGEYYYCTVVVRIKSRRTFFKTAHAPPM